MCGIAGIFDLDGEREIEPRVLKRMTDAIAHRGPDGEGFVAEAGIAFGHRRLAVIDIAGGAQPFTSHKETSLLVHNGEIYNYRDLRRDLTTAGVRFRTNSDTEALVEGLNIAGTDFVARLRGMFAFGWWDRRTRTLTLGRDRLGEKPLYYAISPDGFLIFASEIGGVLASGLVPVQHRLEAVRDYCLYGYVPDPKSIYEGVFKLPPGSILTARRGQAPTLHRYWRPAFTHGECADFKAAEMRLVELIDDAVTAQMIADVPLGAFLSGGVDSSSIVASMAQSRDAITTCTIGFDDARFDERDYARDIAARYETDHHEDVVRIDAISLIDKIAMIYGEPFADPSALPTYEVSAAARRHVTVALSGDGGDEIFGGYRRYPFFLREERIRNLAPLALRRPSFGLAGALYPKLDWAPRPLRLKTTLQALGEDRIAAYARSVSTALPDRLNQILSADFKRETAAYDPYAPIRTAAGDAKLPALDLAQQIDLETWLPGRMLTKVDRASMAHALEVRAPLLDHRLVEWALSLPPSFRLEGGVGKRILKSAMEPRVGAGILYRPKQGFSPPVSSWLRMTGGPAERLRQSAHWRECGYFSADAVDQMLVRHERGAGDYAQELWMVVMFDAFLRSEQAATNSRMSAPSTSSRAA